MDKIKSILNLFRKGSAVLEPAKWKERQITATVLAGVILALVHVAAAFGFVLPVDMEIANSIAAGIIAVVNVILTITTTDKVGLPSKQVDLPQINPDSILPPEDQIKEEADIKHMEAYEKFKKLNNE